MDLAYAPQLFESFKQNFSFTKESFDMLDKLIFTYGRLQMSHKLNEIRTILKDKIRKAGILEFNRFLESIKVTPIDNHISWIIEKNVPIKWDLICKSAAANDIITEHLKTDNQLDWKVLSSNPAAIEILLQNLNKVDLSEFSANPAAVPFLQKNTLLVVWHRMAPVPEAIDMLLENINRFHLGYFMSNPLSVNYFDENSHLIDWSEFSKNPNAIKSFNMRYYDLNWDYVSANTGDDIEEFISKWTDMINWKIASRNSKLINLLNNNPLMIDYNEFSANTAAIKQLSEIADSNNFNGLESFPTKKYIGYPGTNIENLFKDLSMQETKTPQWNLLANNVNCSNLPFINWTNLSMNPAAIPLLARNKNKINYDALMQNPYDYFAEKLNALKHAKLFPSSSFIIG